MNTERKEYQITRPTGMSSFGYYEPLTCRFWATEEELEIRVRSMIELGDPFFVEELIITKKRIFSYEKR